MQLAMPKVKLLCAFIREDQRPISKVYMAHHLIIETVGHVYGMGVGYIDADVIFFFLSLHQFLIKKEKDVSEPLQFYKYEYN